MGWKELPRFLYFNAHYRIADPELLEVWEITVLETLDGKEYALTDYPPPGRGPARCAPYFLDISHRYKDPIITREERDRFEREYGQAISQATKSNSYSTAYIEVLQEAISQFFEPRHDVDPKKAEVVEWVNGRLADMGMPSENIAQAIFTIIKPPDHSPRKRRG